MNLDLDLKMTVQRSKRRRISSLVFTSTCKMFICELVKSKFIVVVYYFSLPVIVPIMPGMPWTYVISSDPLLVHSGCCF